jgi:hypothetical protein
LPRKSLKVEGSAGIRSFVSFCSLLERCGEVVIPAFMIRGWTNEYADRERARKARGY